MEPCQQVVLLAVVLHEALDVLDGLGRGDALDGCLAPELVHLLAALRDGRWQRFHVSVESRRGAMKSSGDFESDSDPMAIAVDEVRSS